MNWAAVLAQATDPTGVFLLAQPDGITTGFLQYGALGLTALLALLAVKVLFQREVKALDLERQRADRLEEELRKLNATVQERYLSTLTEASRVMGDILESTRRPTR